MRVLSGYATSLSRQALALAIVEIRGFALMMDDGLLMIIEIRVSPRKSVSQKGLSASVCWADFSLDAEYKFL